MRWFVDGSNVSNVKVRLKNDDTATIIDNIVTDDPNNSVSLFNINGIRKNKASRGLNIIRNNGSTKKVLVK